MAYERGERPIAHYDQGHAVVYPFPRRKECLQTLLVRESTDKQGKPTIPRSWSTIRMHKVGFDDDAVGGKTTRDELLPREFGQRNEAVDLRRPGPNTSVESQSPRGNQTRCVAVSVTGMHNGRPRHRPVQTILAGLSLTKEETVGARQSIVMKSLNCRHTRPSSRVACRRRNQRERVVKMHHVRLNLSDQLPDIHVRPLVPERLAGKSQKRRSALCGILSGIGEHLIALFPQDLSLS